MRSQTPSHTDDYVPHNTQTRCVSVFVKLQSDCGVWQDQTRPFDRRSHWLSCGHTQEHMWTCDMKTSLVHWRHHLTSWMCYIHTLVYVRMLQLTRYPGTFGTCRIQTYMNKNDILTYELPCVHDKNIQLTWVDSHSTLYQHWSSSKSCPSCLLQCHITCDDFHRVLKKNR